MKDKIAILAIVLVMALMVSGCLTTTVESKVNKDGSIERYVLQFEMSGDMYEMMNGYGDQTIKEAVEEEGATYNEEWKEGNVTIFMTFDNPDPESINVTSEVQGDYIIYRDVSTSNGMLDLAGDETMDDFITEAWGIENPVEQHYYLEMPGNIVESNADIIDGNKAEWHMVEIGDSRPVYAKSEIPSFMPGFSSLMTIFALLGLMFIASRR
jgi:hypothetical protein